MFRLLYITQLYISKEKLVQIINPSSDTIIIAPLSAKNFARKISKKVSSIIEYKHKKDSEKSMNESKNDIKEVLSPRLKEKTSKLMLTNDDLIIKNQNKEIEMIDLPKDNPNQDVIKEEIQNNENMKNDIEKEEKKKSKVTILIPTDSVIHLESPRCEKTNTITPIPETPLSLPENKSFSLNQEKLDLKRFEILKLYVSSEFLLTIFVMAMLFQGILFATINTIYYYDLWVWSKGCVFQVPVFFLVLFSLIIYSGALLIMSIRLYGVKEEFGIKREMLIILLIWIVFMILFILMSAIPYWNRVLEYYFSAVWNIVFACFISNIVGILIPTIKTFNCRKKKGKKTEEKVDHQTLLKYMAKDHKDDPNPLAHDFHTSSHMDAVLEHKLASTFLKQYCVREWSTENILFLEQVREFKKLKNQEDKLKYSNIIYDTFLSNNASLELNTNKRKKDEVLERIKKSNNDSMVQISSEIFNDVEGDIHELMIDTWTRFVESDLFPKMRDSLLKSDFVKENLMDMIVD